MGFATEILFMFFLGWLVLGPKKLQILLRHVARARTEFERATRGFTSSLSAEVAPQEVKTESVRELSENP